MTYPKSFFGLIVGALVLCFSACTPKLHPGDTDDGKIQIAILQMNDVYEIGGVDGGRKGSLARVAAYYKEIKRRYPQSMFMLAGDFLNPSLINTMRYEGERIRGRQIVEVLNAMDLDLVAFGNHEFDLDITDLQKRMDESSFEWIATNIQQVCGDNHYPFYKEVKGKKHFFPETVVQTFTDADGTTAKVGIFSATIDSNPKNYVAYYNPDSCAALAVQELKSSSDIVVGLTHLELGQDMELARQIPGIDLIIGGHEHDHRREQVGSTLITKADANAKTVYLHVLNYTTKSKALDIRSELIPMDTTRAIDPVIDQLVQKWKKVLEANMVKIIPEPFKVVYHASTPLDGRETTIRHRQSNLGVILSESMIAASRNGAQAGLINSGSFRIDDQISGDIRGIDIFRTLPFGGAILDVKIKGSLLIGILDFSARSQGNGAFLQYSGISRDNDQWKIQKDPVDPGKTYNIVLNDFLLRGLDIHFLTEDNPGIIAISRPGQGDKADLRYDIRAAAIDFLQKQ